VCGFVAGVGIWYRGYSAGSSIFGRREAGGGIGVSLSDDIIEEVERRRGLVKRSTYYESLIRKALSMRPEESPSTTRKMQRRTF